jgi:hypothetical protein
MAEIVIIGAGPRGVGVLERIAANAPAFSSEFDLRIHLVDPHPAGAGRIWRRDQSRLLKLNSMAADVTMFTDDSSIIDGPVAPGPSLVEWAARVRSGRIAVDCDELVRAEIEQLDAASFPTRRLQSFYLDWFYRRAVDSLPTHASVAVHVATAVSVTGEADERQLVTLDTGATIVADAVLYALGHTGARPEPEHELLQRYADRNDLVYVPPGYTADVDFGAIRPGEPVIVRGMGLVAVDLTVLLTEGRGGRFVPRAGGGLDYLPSGDEPRLLLGSRRGVPYHSKIGSTLRVPRVEPRFFTAGIAAALETSVEKLSFRDDVWPLIAKEMLWGYYHELFVGHPERVDATWPEFAGRFAPLAFDSGALRSLVAETVPDPLDRLDLREFDRPLAGANFASEKDLQDAVRAAIERDLLLRTSPEHSATLALFYSLLFALFDLGTIIESPKWTARSRIHDLAGWWPNLFSYIASGPPAHRLDELLALSRAGIVTFIGPELRVETCATGEWRASSPHAPGVYGARVLVEARLPAATVARSDNAALRDLVAATVGDEEHIADDELSGTTGRLRVEQGTARVLSPLGEPHERRFAVGAFTNAPFVGAFARPGTNAVSFRENDRVARALLAASGLPTRTQAELVGLTA